MNPPDCAHRWPNRRKNLARNEILAVAHKQNVPLKTLAQTETSKTSVHHNEPTRTTTPIWRLRHRPRTRIF